MLNSLKIAYSDTASIEMILVEGGRFMMGEDNGEHDDEKPSHEVELSGFYMSKYQLTQEFWEAIMEDNPSEFKGIKRPVETVSWNDTQKFLKKLNEKLGESFRLPTEAEWEYAARGGRYSQDYLYAGSDKLKQVGWYDENSNSTTHEVGLLLPNELGLHDMSGNVYEWCEDCFEEKYYEKCKVEGIVRNPVNLEKGAYRVLRGGSYLDYAVSCRSAYRNAYRPDSRDSYFGFRIVLSLQSVG